MRELSIIFGSTCAYSGLANMVLVDNEATVKLLREPRNTERSRHWLIAMSWVRMYQELGHLRVVWVAGSANAADLDLGYPTPARYA